DVYKRQETAVELAYRNNQELRVALLELERSRATLREARAALYPTLDSTAQVQANNSASASTNNNPFFGNTDNTTTTASAGLDLNYDLGLSGGRSARIRAAESSLRGAELEVERVQSQLRLDTVTDYYAIQDATAQIAINQAFLEEAERNLNDTILREEVGVGTRFDVLRSQVQVANARQNVIRAQSQRQIAQRQLAARLNVPPSINVDTLPVEIAGTWPLSLEESIVMAYQGRAELEQLLVQRDIAQAQRQIALSSVRPEVGLFARYNVIQGFSTNLSDFDDGYSLGAQLQWRLFDGGAAVASAEQSDRDAEIAESNFSRTRNDIRFQVEQAYFNLEANQENIDTAQLAVTQAEEAVELANLRFNAGVGTQLDVLTATSELADARGNLVTAILDYNRALATLERAVSNVGTGGAPETP
ncbi:transporter, partial [filamentous cyanobacterium CCP5]